MPEHTQPNTGPDAQTRPRYFVVWTIDVEADDAHTPQDAAAAAWDAMRAPHSTASVFTVTDRFTGTTTTVDLALSSQAP